MNKSPSISKLADALSKAQAEMPAVKMNASNPFLKNKYADLGAVIEATRPVLTKNGLSISQFPTSDGDRIGLTSILMHTSGEWLEDTIFISPSDSKGLSVAQSAGVVISYLRRYQWQSIIGVYSDEDTDGHTTGKLPQSDVSDKLWEHFQKVSDDAVKAGVPNVKVFDRSKTTKAELTAYGTELSEAIKKAGK
jgi:hypothetical protein